MYLDKYKCGYFALSCLLWDIFDHLWPILTFFVHMVCECSLLACFLILCLSMAALTSENLLWANCSWVGGAKSTEFWGETVEFWGMGTLTTTGFIISDLRRPSDLLGLEPEAEKSFLLSVLIWLNLLSRTRCSMVEAGFWLTKTYKRYQYFFFLQYMKYICIWGSVPPL